MGDLIPTLQLAHAGFGEGILVAEHIAGLPVVPIDYYGVPRITYMPYPFEIVQTRETTAITV